MFGAPYERTFTDDPRPCANGAIALLASERLVAQEEIVVADLRVAPETQPLVPRLLGGLRRGVGGLRSSRGRDDGEQEQQSESRPRVM